MEMGNDVLNAFPTYHNCVVLRGSLGGGRIT